jgi:acyl carrier protein
MTQDLQLTLSRFVTTDLLNDGTEDLDTAFDLLSTDMIDSIGVMQLIAFVEKEFGLKVPPQDVTFENFVSVNAMAHYLMTLKSRKSNA